MSSWAPVVMDFSQVKKGTRAKVVHVPPSLPQVRRLQEMGLVDGTEFRVVKVAPLGDPIEIEIRGYRLCLRKKETAGIDVEVLS